MNSEDTIIDPSMGAPRRPVSEDTIIDSANKSAADTQHNEDTIVDSASNHSVPVSGQQKSSGKWKYAAAGAALAGGVTLAAQTAASTPSGVGMKQDNDLDLDDNAADNTASADEDYAAAASSPNPEEVIVTTDEGVRVAHVSDDLSFSQAFAQARQQVGPGGVFEWHGRVYGTFYKDEWESMSAQEKADYQASIDYSDVTGGHTHHTAHSPQPTHHNAAAHHTAYNDDMAYEPDTVHTTHAAHASQAVNVDDDIDDDIIIEPDDDDVNVVIIDQGETDLNDDGVPEYSVLVDCNGQEILFVDIDRDDIAEVMISDFNNDGEIDESEIIDISEDMVELPPMEEADDPYLTASNDMPDYMDDANVDAFLA